MATHINLNPLPGAGYIPRLIALIRRLLSFRMMLRLAGVDTITLEGRVCILREVPLGIAREMIPALVRSARSFGAWDINEALYDDFITVIALGLRLPRHVVENLTIPLWELAPVVESIAKVNGVPTMEAGRSELGKMVAVLTSSTGTGSSPGSSAAPVGPGSTSNNA